MLGNIHSSDGMKFAISYFLKVGVRYLKNLPKEYNVEGLIIKEPDGTLLLPFPLGKDGEMPWNFVKCLENGASFKVELTPKYATPGGGNE